ncbi:sensor histidine kinase [Pedobacter kyungheensis]|uniref:sensor histidine kinase n=1 Tax=Pedobacter kyungheensis TaxID=1069985 RepID=UPI00068E7EFC|nr:histidine kinase [Pedobacter kyungheensis]
MLTGLKKLLINWIAHFVMMWIAITAFTLIPYLYHVHMWGNYIVNTDGTPVSGWQYATNLRSDLFVVALCILLTEAVRIFLFKKYHFIVFIGGCLLTGMISCAGIIYLRPNVFKQQGKLSAIEPILYIAVYAFIYVIVRDYYLQYKNRKLYRIQQSENELHALKAQLNPHFLFNALNYLYGTALKENAPDTAHGIDIMSDMMRYTIHGMHENFVQLQDELKFMENYLRLQQVRLPAKESIKINKQIVSDDHKQKIAPLLLLPFIENAFKYGISMDAQCEVQIKIVVVENELQMEVFNTIVQNRAEVGGNNTGIKNTIKRLDLLYPDSYRLDHKNTGLDYKVSFWLKLSS